VILATKLLISASIIIVCYGGFTLLLIDGCVGSICFLKIDAWIELRSLFVGHALLEPYLQGTYVTYPYLELGY
jgi:hypothetical protein